MKTKKYALAIALGSVGLLVPNAAWGDSIVFNASGTFTDGSVLVGTVTIDTTSGQVTAATLDLANSTLAPLTLTFQGPEGGDPFYAINTNDPTRSLFIQLIVPQSGPSNLAGYSGGPLCSEDFHCVTQVGFLSATNILGGLTNLQSGTLAPVPEPSSLLLLGTGLVGMLAAVRRKLIA